MTKPTRKKILFLITKSSWGGAGHYVFDLATQLDKDAFDVVVALGGSGALYEMLHKKGIRVISLCEMKNTTSLTQAWRACKELYTILKAENPNVLHLNSSVAGLVGACMGKLVNTQKIIFTAHGWAFNEDRPWWQKIIIKKLHWITIVLAHTTIVVSEATKRQMNLPFVQKKMLVIHNGRTAPDFYSRDFARSFFAEYAPTLREHTKDFWSVTIAELHPIKQHEVTLRALANVLLENKNFRHIIIGDGEEKLRLHTLVEELGLSEHVFFVSINPNASQYLKGFDLFVLASRSEALAYVIIEACIAGLPIVASNVGGIPEIITHEKDGILFPQGDVEALTKYYTQLLSDEKLRNALAQNALLRAQDFTLEKMVEKTTKLY